MLVDPASIQSLAFVGGSGGPAVVQESVIDAPSVELGARDVDITHNKTPVLCVATLIAWRGGSIAETATCGKLSSSQAPRWEGEEEKAKKMNESASEKKYDGGGSMDAFCLRLDRFQRRQPTVWEVNESARIQVAVIDLPGMIA